MPSRTRRPVSSSTSRTAAATAVSPRSSLPLGNDQSSYAGRWTSRTLPLRRTTAPAARTSPGLDADGMRLVSHHPRGEVIDGATTRARSTRAETVLGRWGGPAGARVGRRWGPLVARRRRCVVPRGGGPCPRRHPARVVDRLGGRPCPRGGRPVSRVVLRGPRPVLAPYLRRRPQLHLGTRGIRVGPPAALRLLAGDGRLGALQPVRPGSRGDAAPAVVRPRRSGGPSQGARLPGARTGRRGLERRPRPGVTDLARPHPGAVLPRGRPRQLAGARLRLLGLLVPGSAGRAG